MEKKLLGVFFVVFLLVSFMLPGSFVFAVEFPSPTGFVNDYAGVIGPADRTELEQVVLAFEQQTSNEISIAIVNSLEGLDEFTYAHELFSKWKPGKADKNNGILFLIAIGDRAAFVEVGKGLEGALPDSLTGTILRNEVFPSFKAGDYAGGIKQGVAAIIQATEGEYKAEPGSSGSGYADYEEFWTIIVPLGFILLQYFLSFLARSKSWWLGGVLGGAGGLIFGYVFLSIASMILVAGIFAGSGLFLDFVLSRNFQKRLKEGKPTDFWHSGGGWFGGGHGGGGGFGGFGGGISGGGGAGGRW